MSLTSIHHLKRRKKMQSKSRKIVVQQVSKLLANGYRADELIKGFVHVNQETWGGLVPEKYIWTPEKIAWQIRTCPDLLYCGFIDGEIVGTLSMMLIDELDAVKTESWEKTTQHGTLRSHNPEGNSIFGADLTVSPRFQGIDISGALMKKAFMTSVILDNKRGAYLGSRIPRYHKYASRMSVENYVFGEKRDGKTKDPEIRLYQSEGFQLVRTVPGYMEDPESLNYGVLMFWPNPYYGKIPWVIRKISSFFFSR